MFAEAAFILQISVKSSAAVLLAALGETLCERAGVLNLGVEGMMLMGALAGFAAGYVTGDPFLATAGAMIAGSLMASVHAFFTITIRANQVLSGLALTILGMGLSSVLGRELIGKSGYRFTAAPIPWLEDIPLLGKAFFMQTPLVYTALALTPLLWWFLMRTRRGLAVRAVGEDAAAADAAGLQVARTRYACVLAGGALAGLAGGALSLAYTPGWKEGMTGGQGWIAIAMVVFATWNPLRVFLGALLFGGLTALQFYFQVAGGGAEVVPVYLLQMAPYVLTIAVLAAVNRVGMARGRGAAAPGDLGVPFARG